MDITFTLNPSGAPEILCMEDRQTQIVISKKDITNQEELPGAHLQVLDRNGIVQEEWISERTRFESVILHSCHINGGVGA